MSVLDVKLSSRAGVLILTNVKLSFCAIFVGIMVERFAAVMSYFSFDIIYIFITFSYLFS